MRAERMAGILIKTNLIDDGIENHITQQFPRYAKLAVY